jgi:GTPase SAR1 family protein
MRIGISGTQSVGKTTLLNALRSEEFFKDYTVCDEVTRWVKSLGLPINEGGTDSTQELIMMKHVYNVFMNDNMITDRTALDGLVYSNWLYDNKKISDQTLHRVEEVFAKLISSYDYMFFIEPEFDVVNDGVRSTDVTFRDSIHTLFKEAINRHGLTVYPIKGSVRLRVEQVLKTLNIQD